MEEVLALWGEGAGGGQGASKGMVSQEVERVEHDDTCNKARKVEIKKEK